MNGSFSTSGRRNDTFDFTIPAGMIFSVPAEQVVSEISPAEVDTRDHFLRVMGSNNRHCYVPKGALMIRSGQQSPSKEVNSNAPETYSKKKEAQYLDMKAHVKRLQAELIDERDELKSARNHIAKLQRNIKEWKDGYEAMSSAAQESNEGCMYQYNLRMKVQKETQRKLDEMAARVFELGSENEETKITEDQLLKDYENLVETIKAATGAVTFHLDQDDVPARQMVLSAINFGDMSISNNLDVFNVRLPSILLHILLEHAEKELYTTLTDVFTQHDMGGQTQVIGNGLKALEHEMKVGIRYGQSEVAKAKKQQKTKAQKAAEQDTATLMKSFYRWRADTVRLLSLVQKDNLATSEKSKADIVDTVCAQFFAALHPKGTDHSLNPVDFFQGTETGNKNRANARLKQFIKKLDECVEKVMAMLIRIRTCRPNYEFQWYNPQTLNRSYMEISEAHQLTEKERRRHEETTLAVISCRFPALVKFGDDDGKGYDRHKVVQKAEVIVDGLLPQSAMGDITPQEDDAIAVDDQYTTSENRNRGSVVPTRSSSKLWRRSMSQAKGSGENIGDDSRAISRRSLNRGVDDQQGDTTKSPEKSGSSWKPWNLLSFGLPTMPFTDTRGGTMKTPQDGPKKYSQDRRSIVSSNGGASQAESEELPILEQQDVSELPPSDEYRIEIRHSNSNEQKAAAGSIRRDSESQSVYQTQQSLDGAQRDKKEGDPYQERHITQHMNDDEVRVMAQQNPFFRQDSYRQREAQNRGIMLDSEDGQDGKYSDSQQTVYRHQDPDFPQITPKSNLSDSKENPIDQCERFSFVSAHDDEDDGQQFHARRTAMKG